MIKRPNTKAQRLHRHTRVRAKISGTPERPRLNVFRSNTNIYAQIIDDVAGVTLVSASTLDKSFEGATATRKPPARSASCWPSARRRRASRLWSSTAAAMSIMAVSRNWLRAPARVDSSFKREEDTNALSE